MEINAQRLWNRLHQLGQIGVDPQGRRHPLDFYRRGYSGEELADQRNEGGRAGRA